MFLSSVNASKLVWIAAVFWLAVGSTVAQGEDDPVTVEIYQPGDGPLVTTENRYTSMVTLYYEDPFTGSEVPSGWSTRQEDGAFQDRPWTFRPGQNLLPGLTEGVLQLHVGDRAKMYVPSSKGYGARQVGGEGGAINVPANADLIFDIEILSIHESANKKRNNTNNRLLRGVI